VTHGGVLSMLLRNTLGIPLAEPRRYQLANGSISRFVVGHGIWELVTWSDANHLGTLRQLDDR
jgi:broad specificity phosphatase PhoE